MKSRKRLRILVFLLCLNSLLVLLSNQTQAKYAKQQSHNFEIRTAQTAAVSTAFPQQNMAQSYSAVKSGYYVIQLWGADGGNSSEGHLGGSGGYTLGVAYFEAGTDLTFVVGGQGGTGRNINGTDGGGAGGFNGGGSGGSSGITSKKAGGGGGGSTNVRLASVDVMIAGGGGGAGSGNTENDGGKDTPGGSGGTGSLTAAGTGSGGWYLAGSDGFGDNGTQGGNYAGLGGSDTGGLSLGSSGLGYWKGNAGSYGSGGNAGDWGGGGGGGFYGGGGGSASLYNCGGGGGGSSFYNASITVGVTPGIATVVPSAAQYSDSYVQGQGFAIITYIGTVLP